MRNGSTVKFPHSASLRSETLIGKAPSRRLPNRHTPVSRRPRGRIPYTGGLLVGDVFGQPRTATTATGAEPAFADGVNVSLLNRFEPL